MPAQRHHFRPRPSSRCVPQAWWHLAMVVGANMLTNYFLGWGLLRRGTLRLFACQDGGKTTWITHTGHHSDGRCMRVSR